MHFGTCCHYSEFDRIRGVVPTSCDRRRGNCVCATLITWRIAVSVLPASKCKVLDLNMLVMNGGRERTAIEFCQLFDAAGLRMTRIIPTLSPLSIVEAVRD